MSTATSTSRPQAPMPAPARSTDDLIAEAEASVVRADAQISVRTHALKRSLVAQTSKLAVGAVVASAVVGVLIWRPWKSKHVRRRDRARERLSKSADSAASRGYGLRENRWSIFSLIGLIWPMIPWKLPSPVGPKMTAFLLGMGLPLAPANRRPVGDGAGAPDSGPPPEVEQSFDPVRYFGRWYEIARLPLSYESSCVGDVTATYAPIVDGSGQISVTNRCRNVAGGYDVADGVAKLAGSAGAAKLKVSFAPAFLRALPFVWADYWVLQVDPDYSIAVVGTPDRKHLWFLAREPHIDDAAFDQMSKHAVGQGYDLSNLIRTIQHA